ncbi:MAG: PAS domain-containing sensor histidine kinase [Holophagales bacterium]|nr:PAS domain-containing sensor histidine kinase [Holophagales bacterium]
MTRHLDLIRHAASPLPSSVPSGDAGGVGFATQVSGIFLADAEGILVGHDSGLVAVSGLPAARLVATPVRELLVPVMDGTRHPADIVAESGRTAVAAVRVMPRGPVLLLSCEPWTGPSAVVVGEVSRPDADLETSAAALRVLAEGVVVRSLDGGYFTCNEAAERILGLSRDQLMGAEHTPGSRRTLREDGSSFPLEEHPTAVTLATGRACRDVVMGIEHDDGSLTWISVNTRPLVHAGEARPWAVLSSFSDISRLKETQDALEVALELSRELNEQLERKNEELERYAHTVAHDLRSPLTAVLAHLDFAVDSAAEGDLEAMHEELRSIDVAATRMRTMLDELLELSRLGQQVAFSDGVNLEEVAREAAEMVSPEVGGRRVEIRLRPGLPTVRGDRLRLRQVFQNLLHNACKFMGDQLEPTVSVSPAELAGLDGEVAIEVRDNGIGLRPEDQQAIFGLFRTLGHRESGSGLGLALVERVVELHGGRVWVESEGPGRGSAFTFTLRRQPAEC